jgi:hypothetical protein
VIVRGLFVVVLFVFSSAIIADTYLCVGEAGAVVSHGGKRGLESIAYSKTDSKYVLSNNSGEWLLKSMGHDTPIFDSCVSQYYCENTNYYGGTFYRGKDGYYGIVRILFNETEENLVTEKGRCSKL